MKYANKLQLKNRDGTPKRIFLHLARHSGITILMEEGVGAENVRLQTGHKTTDVIKKHYYHPNITKVQKRCVEILTEKEENIKPEPLTTTDKTEDEKKKSEPSNHDTDIMVAELKKQLQLQNQLIQLLQDQVKGLQKPDHDIGIQSEKST